MKFRINKLILSMLFFNFLLQIVCFKVFANGQDLVINFPGGQISGNVISYNVDDQDITVTINERYTINNSTLTIDSDDFLQVFTINNFNSETMNIKIYSDNGFSTYLTYSNGILYRETEGGYPNEFNFIIEKKQDQHNSHDENHNKEFDENAYFVWESNGDICYHKFENLVGRNGETYEINYIKYSDVIDESINHTGAWSWKQGRANWVLARDVENEGQIDPQKMTLDYVFGNGEENMGIQLDPCGAKSGESSVSTNGDRNFRATIYKDDEYESISFGASLSDYQYFPSFWDQVFYSNILDISGTTKSKPAVYEAYLLEPSIKFGTGVNSKSTFKSVKALDVNDNAVTITKDSNSGQYIVTFNSNYYDNVKFEIEDENDTKYYLEIDRVVLQIHDNLGPNLTENPKLTAQLIYPTTYNYQDFEVVATTYNKDGSTKNSILSVDKIKEDEFNQGNIYNDGYSADGGKNLRYSEFNIEFDSDKLEGVYFTVIHKGALEGNTYGGTFGGSGKGIYYKNRALE